MNRLLQDLRHSLRSLRQQPGFAAVVVLTLALGIGANTTVFTVIYAVLMRPLPHIDTDGLMALAMRHAVLNIEAYDFSFPDVDDFAEQCTVCAGVAAYDREPVVLADGGELRAPPR